MDEETEDYAYIPQLCENTNGFIASYDETYESCLTEIYGEVPVLENAYKAIIATGYHTIVLDAPITIGYREAAEDVKANPQNLERYRNSGMVDTDDDELLDFQEINFDIYGKNGLLIQFDEDGYIKELPLATVCSDLYFNTKDKEGEKPLTYVEKGWEYFENSAYYDDLSEIHILPIISDPTSEDGDGDGAPDSMDSEKLKKNINDCFFEILVKKDIITTKDLIESGDGLIICKKPLSEIIFDCCGSDVELKSNVENIHSYDNNEIEELFSCWYIVMVKTAKGVAYSGIKIITNDDLKLKSSSVSFKSFNPFEIIMYNEIEEKKNGYIQNELYNMTAKEKRSSVLGFAKIHDPVLYDYYFGISSIGEYFIADFCVERIIKDATDKKFKFLKLGYEDGKNYIQFEYNIDKQRIQREFYTIGYDKYSIPTLIKYTITKGYSTIISRYTTGYNIMEKVDNVKDDGVDYDIYRIYINDINNLSTIEKNCIIAAFFGNECYSSYAAEISIHADGLLGISPISNIRYNNVLVADMTCYESSIESDMYINIVDYTNKQSKKHGGKYDC